MSSYLIERKGQHFLVKGLNLADVARILEEKGITDWHFVFAKSLSYLN